MKLDLPADLKLGFEMVIPIRWGDMDAMGHVNNAVYFRYMETVRVEWLNGIGAAPNPQGQGPVIVNAFCNFIQQLAYPGEVLARHYVASPGRSSFDTFITLERLDQPGLLYAEGGATTVWLDFPSGKSAPLPDWLRAHLG
jgi:acyl-CoA thioester hydrolase